MSNSGSIRGRTVTHLYTGWYSLCYKRMKDNDLCNFKQQSKQRNYGPCGTGAYQRLIWSFARGQEW